MPVEFVSTGFVHDLVSRIAAARGKALDGFERMPAPGSPDETIYWEGVLEANAALVLGHLSSTKLPADYAVRYRFFENRDGMLRIRPFVVRAQTDVATAKRLLDWHPPPDMRQRSPLTATDRDADLLYRHFSLSRTAEGVFEYWLAMQEIWASTRWAHARVIANADELGQILSRPEWLTERNVEHCAPAVMTNAGDSSHLAVLVYSPIGRESVTLEQIEIPPDQTINYADAVVVASGPKGYVLQ